MSTLHLHTEPSSKPTTTCVLADNEAAAPRLQVAVFQHRFNASVCNAITCTLNRDLESP